MVLEEWEDFEDFGWEDEDEWEEKMGAP